MNGSSIVRVVAISATPFSSVAHDIDAGGRDHRVIGRKHEDPSMRREVSSREICRKLAEVEVDRENAEECSAVARVDRSAAGDSGRTVLCENARRRPCAAMSLDGGVEERARAWIVMRVVFVSCERPLTVRIDAELVQLGAAIVHRVFIQQDLPRRRTGRASERPLEITPAHADERRVRAEHIEQAVRDCIAIRHEFGRAVGVIGECLDRPEWPFARGGECSPPPCGLPPRSPFVNAPTVLRMPK